MNTDRRFWHERFDGLIAAVPTILTAEWLRSRFADGCTVAQVCEQLQRCLPADVVGARRLARLERAVRQRLAELGIEPASRRPVLRLIDCEQAE